VTYNILLWLEINKLNWSLLIRDLKRALDEELLIATPLFFPVRQVMRGALMMTAAGAFYTLNDAAMKLALSDTSNGWAIFIRGVNCCAVLLIVAFQGKGFVKLRWTNLRGQLECGAYYVLAAFLFIYSLPNLSFPVAVTALYTSPLFLVLLAPLLLHERLNSVRLSATVVGFLGAALTARPSTGVFSWLVLFPLGSAFATAMRDITLRKLVQSDNSFSILFFQQFSLMLFGLAYSAVAPTAALATSQITYGIILAASLGVLLGVYCTIEAFRASDVSAVSALRYLAIVWAALIGAAVWNDRFSFSQILGMLLVIASGTAVTLSERRLYPRKIR
jgi:drug/metabolite transporter (DMT)-like permease